MTRIFLIVLLFSPFAYTNAEYPEFFSKLGTPLYKADKAFMQLSHLEGMEKKAEYYHSRSQHLLSVAKSVEADPKTKKAERKAYVRQLRLLEKEHNEILLTINAILLKSIDNDDYKTFSQIINADLDTILDNNVIRKRSMAYYVSNRTRGIIDKLDKILSSIDSDPQLSDYVQGHLPKVQLIEETYALDGPIHNLSLSRNAKLAYLASDRHCFKLLQIKNFSSTSELSSFAFPEKECRLVHVNLSRDFTHAYLSDLNNGFAIMDVTRPRSLVLEGAYPRMKALYSLTSDDEKTAFVVHKNRGISILNISNIEEPRLLANYNHGLKASRLAYDENSSRLYVTHEQGLSVLDVSILGNPREVLRYDLAQGAYDIVLSTKRKAAFLSSYDEGVHVLDISDEQNITRISRYQTSEKAHQLTLSEDETALFISTMTKDLYHVDTRKLDDLRHVVTYRLEEKADSEEVPTAFSATLDRSQTHLFISYGAAGIAKISLKK